MSISRNALKRHGTVNAQNLQKLLDDLEREEEIHAETKKREMDEAASKACADRKIFVSRFYSPAWSRPSSSSIPGRGVTHSLEWIEPDPNDPLFTPLTSRSPSPVPQATLPVNDPLWSTPPSSFVYVNSSASRGTKRRATEDFSEVPSKLAKLNKAGSVNVPKNKPTLPSLPSFPLSPRSNKPSGRTVVHGRRSLSSVVDENTSS